MASGSGGFNARDDEEMLKSGGFHHQNHAESGYHCRHYFSACAFNKIALIFATVTLVCLVLNQSTYPTLICQRSFLLPGPNDSSSSLSNNAKSNDENLLESTLRNASMEDNRTVIITTVNAAWMEPNNIFDLFLESFRIGNKTEHLLKYLMVVALDKNAYSRCLEVHHHCYALITEGVDFTGEAHFMSEDYLKMMWKRIDFLRSVLELGYNFVFTDADVMWLRDPFQRFYPDGDFQIACDHYMFNSTDVNNLPNGGFKYVKANNRTVQFYKFWHTGKDYFPGKPNQPVLNMIKSNPFVKEIGLEMRFLDTAIFGGFCEPSKDLDLVVTMHANCCVGIENKIHDLKMVISDWKNYMALPSGKRNLGSRSWTVPWICGNVSVH